MKEDTRNTGISRNKNGWEIVQEERGMRFHRTKLTTSVSLPRASIVATDTMVESKPTKSRKATGV